MAEQDVFLTSLDELERRFTKIERQIADPETACDSARIVALSKEQGKLKDTVAKYREYRKTTQAIADAQVIIEDESVDEDFRALAEDEKKQLEDRRESLLEQIKNALVMGEDSAINSVIVEIRAGTGGEEAALFARDLYGMYVKYAEGQRWKVEQLDFSPTEKGGFREMIFSVKGPGVWSELGYEGGGHRVQRVPQTESQGQFCRSLSKSMSR